jgi:hypothetical protein
MKAILSSFLIFSFFLVAAQTGVQDNINRIIQQNESAAHLSFLAADEMRGRDAGSNELNIAANYIRTQFRLLNLKPAPGTDDFFQYVDLVKYSAPSSGRVVVGEESFSLNENLVVLDGGPVNWAGELVYVGYGSEEELKGKNIEGKVVLALAGSRDADNINKVFMASRDKYSLVQKLGAAGLVEVLTFPQVPWQALVNFFGKDKWSLREGKDVPFVWIKPGNVKDLAKYKSPRLKGSLSINAPRPEFVKGRNVAALVEGTDPGLKEQYIVMTAHYDHVGITREESKPDSIYNGARDNATGTTALLQTAKYLSLYPPKRSVILMTVTCEEKGLLGSKWYVRHPLVPLNKTILNFNCDGVGYNDKSRVTSISLGRTNMDEHLRKAAFAYGLTLGGDPDPSEGFYERSDQVSFAKEGVPAVKLQPGLATMDDEIMKYYHQPADEVASLDLQYINTFYRTFVYAVHLIANDDKVPAWVPGDKFEEASKKLYTK